MKLFLWISVVLVARLQHSGADCEAQENFEHSNSCQGYVVNKESHSLERFPSPVISDGNRVGLRGGAYTVAPKAPHAPAVGNSVILNKVISGYNTTTQEHLDSEQSTDIIPNLNCREPASVSEPFSMHASVGSRIAVASPIVARSVEPRINPIENQSESPPDTLTRLLHHLLPEHALSAILRGVPVPLQEYDDITVFFSDIEGFTSYSSTVMPKDVYALLDELYFVMDLVSSFFPILKINTIGDGYMAVGKMSPSGDSDNQTRAVCEFALAVQAVLPLICLPQTETPVSIRMGIHSGPAVAGIAGLRMPRYSVFGDTVNVAARMESTGVPQKIHVSEQVFNKLNGSGFTFEARGPVDVKGKGQMSTYILVAGPHGGATSRNGGLLELISICSSALERRRLQRVNLSV
eukprot:GHVT01053166.1.p1 GENE.GHVT01053166.1~~GHVT01053166.1.p1  ORF type:complete len:407 (-),score=19.31 GHVT01053166.1:2174-3394(-)